MTDFGGNGVQVRSDLVSAVLLSKVGEETKMLLLKRADEAYWCHVGGKLESGETARVGVVREIREETGITEFALYSADYIQQFYKADLNQIFMVTCFVAVCVGSPPVTLNPEHTDYRWSGLEEAERLVPFLNQKALYAHVWQHFVQQMPPTALAVAIP